MAGHVFWYEEWLLYFAVSLAWRCLATSNGDGLRDHPHHAEAIDRATNSWKSYLLGCTNKVGSYRLNLFFTPLGGHSESRIPDGLAWYSARGVDMTSVYSNDIAATYVKLPGMFFWTSIVPPDPGGWRRTRIAKRGTIHNSKQEMRDAAASS
jgi:hypothetical protein